MYRKYLLQPLDSRDAKLDFGWDPQTGDLSGPSAKIVERLAAYAQKTGSVQGRPYPTDYPVADPLHSISDMAVVLGQYWILPADLAAAHPSPVDDGEDFPGALN